ncbi:MAG TPA: ABC transporter permease [Blastocatellia bacterium]|nr:ABC transporter permease [Blastocatellia bacterium]
MGRLGKFWRLVLFLFGRNHFDQELQEEMQLHLEMSVQNNVDSGMTQDEARHYAARRFGNDLLIRERSREVWLFYTLEILAQDLRYAARVLVKNPGFSVVAVIALALGIGANTAIFSIVNAVLLRPLPFAQPDKLLYASMFDLRLGSSYGFSYPNFRDISSESTLYEKMSVVTTGGFTLTGDGEPVRLLGELVSTNLFSMLGVTPKIGRDFLPGEDKPESDNGAPPVILSEGLWRDRFGSDPGVLGRIIKLNDNNYTIVGVMPRGFQFPVGSQTIDLWTTFSYLSTPSGDSTPITEQRGYDAFDLFARLKSDASVAQAQSEMDAIASRLEQRYPDKVRICA